MTSYAPTAVGGPTWTRTTRTLLLIAIVGVALIVWRFWVGLGASTGLSDGYPWGIWIAFDVVTGTALACGGYAMALVVYIFNRGQYHPLVRPAILTSALGYSIAALAIVIDVGRPWFVYRIPISWDKWNHSSALLEVALCVMAYVIVLWIEMAPAFTDKWQHSPNRGFANLARRVGAGIQKSLVFIVALGVVLPTMHQSSLGTVIMLAGPRLHPLWHTPWLPFLFLVSCIAMGYGMVAIESMLSARAFGLPREDSLLYRLNKLIAGLLLLFVVWRLVEIVVQGETGYLFGSGGLSILFWVEMLLFVAPAISLLTGRATSSPTCMLRAAGMILLAGAMYRFDAYLVAFDPGPGWEYFPSLPEFLITVGLIAVELLVYILLVKKFPILSGARAAAAAREGGKS
jgi:Ni/Fe-hydrogenase subunit HybB-like protein